MQKTPRFDKKQLAIALGLASYSGRVYYHRLRLEVFTDDFLKRVGLTLDEYTGKRIWPHTVRMRIMCELQLSPDDFRAN